MSTFNTRCPSCSGVNRVPTERISESPKCGKCQAALLDGAPIEGTELNLDAILQSDQPVVIDFWAHGVTRVLALPQFFLTLPKNAHKAYDL